MANILLISVREDAPRTGALAQRFEATGFSVSDGVSSDAALRSAAAGVLLWSQESRQAPLFQDAARRVVKAGKAVVARLTDTLPAEGFGILRAFDLSAWQGDPQDPLLDKMHDAVRQMVVRDLCAQAEYWRSISGSGDASAFLDYLTRYGPDGAFAALADSRLKRLAAGEPLARPRIASQPRAAVAAPVPHIALSRASISRAKPAPPPPRALPAPSRASHAVGRDKSDPRASDRREPGAFRFRSAMIVIPFLVGVTLGGAVSFNGFGDSNNVLGPTETLAAPIDAGILYLDPPAPAAWAPPLAPLRAAESEHAAAAPPASAESVPPPTMSWESSDTPAKLMLLAAAPLTPPEPGAPLAPPPVSIETSAIAPEQVFRPQSGAAYSEAIAQPTPRNADLSASSPLDSIAGAAALAARNDTPVGADYGPQV